MAVTSSGNGGPASVEFRMPSLGADMIAGTVVQWRVKPGDRVKRGDVVAEVETEKGVFEVDLTVGGTVDELLVPAGAKVPVGAVLARLRGEGVAPTAAPSPPPSAMPEPKRPLLRASPAARRLAAERGIALDAIVGTGPGHIIRLEDVRRAVGAVAPMPAPPVAVAAVPAIAPSHAAAPPSAAAHPPAPAAAAAMRQAIAAAVSRSKREIPHYYLSTDIDLAAAMRWLGDTNARRAITERLLAAPLLLKAVALALRRFPALNGSWVDGILRPADAVHVGIAVSLRGGGLIAPAIHDVDALPLDGLMAALRDLAQRARGGGLRASEMTDATITVTNLGDEGASAVFGVIYPPQVAIVGFGRIVERPWAVNGMLGVRPIVTATLAADHRATDGHYGGRFLAEIDRLLQHPESL